MKYKVLGSVYKRNPQGFKQAPCSTKHMAVQWPCVPRCGRQPVWALPTSVGGTEPCSQAKDSNPLSVEVVDKHSALPQLAPSARHTMCTQKCVSQKSHWLRNRHRMPPWRPWRRRMSPWMPSWRPWKRRMPPWRPWKRRMPPWKHWSRRMSPWITPWGIGMLLERNARGAQNNAWLWRMRLNRAQLHYPISSCGFSRRQGFRVRLKKRV